MKHAFRLSILVAGLLMAAVPSSFARAQAAPQRFEITAKRFSFTPNEITVKKGQPVTIVLKSMDVDHGLRIRDLYIHSDKDEAQPLEKPVKKPAANLFSFAGRVPRSAFWGMTIMIHILCVFIYFIIEKIVGPDVLQNKPSLVFFALTLAVAAAASLALHVRRWHDLNKSGWLAAAYLIPVVAAFVSVIVFGFENKIYLVAVALALIAMVFAGFNAGSKGPGKFGNIGSPGLLGYRQTWSFFAGKFMTDGIWWFYLFWLPDYLEKQFHMTKTHHAADVHRLWRRHRRQRLWRQHSR